MAESSVEPNVSAVAEKWKDVRGSLIMALHEIQDEMGYVPRKVCMELAKQMGVPLARIYEVITFYSYFRLEAPGKHKISVCMGTACYLKGAPDLVEELAEQLGVEEGQTSKDGLFQFESVRCVGCCGLAPVIMIDDKVYGKVDRAEVASILADYETRG